MTVNCQSVRIWREHLTGVDGYATISVLWIVTLLSVLTLSYHQSARREAGVLATSVYQAHALGRAEAAIWVTMQEELASEERDLSVLTRRLVDIDGTTVEVVIAEASGKVNLNHADESMLNRVLAHAGVADWERVALVDSILDWRDSDNTPRERGAEDPAYAAAGHGASDGPFLTIDELRHVLGITEPIFRSIESQLTVFGEHTRVSARAADIGVLSALSDLSQSDIEAYLVLRDDGDDSASLDLVDSVLTGRSRGDIYVVTSKSAAGPIEVRIEATLRMPRRGTDSVVTLDWN
jgi:general secretion pathway protein K